jgi:glycosyltransferase involved in cell wall biosynthesis
LVVEMSAREPTVTAVVAAYQSEQWIVDCLDSILGQTRPPDEVVVVDDGSTDGTPELLAAYGDRIRVIRQENAGYPTAMNRAIRESSSTYVAPCGADDIWEPRKLEWQVRALQEHPECEVLFGHAVFFGKVVGDHPRPTGSGVLDGDALWEDLFRKNVINTPSAVIHRGLFDRVGRFTDGFLADDYEFFFNCLRAGVRFYYEPRPIVRYRRHDDNITNDWDELREAMVLMRTLNADRVRDRRLVDAMLAPDLFKIGRRLVDDGRRREGRRAFVRSLRHARGNPAAANARALVWVGILSLPGDAHRYVGRSLVGISRALDALRGGRNPVLP